MVDSKSDDENPFIKAFADPEAVKGYTDGVRRFVPGLGGLHRMTAVLLAERAPKDARILVLGAGGGVELSALAKAEPGWTFVGVDPAPEMLSLAKDVMGEDAPRAELVEGYITDAPSGPFDGAVCLLTLHFLNAVERLHTVREIHKRLRPGAPFVAAHTSLPSEPSARALLLSRYAAYGVASGADPEATENMRKTVEAHLPMLSPAQDESILREAGFQNVEEFYVAFTWRGWTGTA